MYFYIHDYKLSCIISILELQMLGQRTWQCTSPKMRNHLHFPLWSTASNLSGCPVIIFSTSLSPQSYWQSCQLVSSMFRWIRVKSCPCPSRYCCRSRCSYSSYLTIRRTYHITSLFLVRNVPLDSWLRLAPATTEVCCFFIISISIQIGS